MILTKQDSQHIRIYALLALAVIIILYAPHTYAQDNVSPPSLSGSEIVDIMPSHSTDKTNRFNEDDNTHPPIRLTPDKSEILDIDREAASIIVGNPNHLGILADSTKRLVLVPRAPGASYFTILDRNGDVVMQRHAIIASPKKQYVRIRRTCAGNNNCQETSVFYCPDMCHEIMIGSGSGNDSQNAQALANSSGASSGARQIPNQEQGQENTPPPPPESFNEPAE